MVWLYIEGLKDYELFDNERHVGWVNTEKDAELIVKAVNRLLDNPNKKG